MGKFALQPLPKDPKVYYRIETTKALDKTAKQYGKFLAANTSQSLGRMSVVPKPPRGKPSKPLMCLTCIPQAANKMFT